MTAFPAARAFCERFEIDLPIIQAPMAGISTPALAAAVSNAGGLGSIGVGATDATGAGQAIMALRALSNRAFNVNVFCHRPAKADADREVAWLNRLRAEFDRFDAVAPARIGEIYKSFLADDAMLALLLETRPAIVSFHFGLPAQERIDALRDRGIKLLATATDVDEGLAAQAAGVDAVVAQGFEAGGHRGVFDPAKSDDELSTATLVKLLIGRLNIPVIAAGGLMDGDDIAAFLRRGAAATQLGTAFVTCPESSAEPAYRAAFASPAAWHTRMTRAVSGRPARSLASHFTALEESVALADIPDYPIAYDAGKALHAAAKAKGDHGFGAYWAGQGAPFARPLPAAELVALLAKESGWR